MTKYQSPRNIRRENRTLAGRFRGGKLAPVMAQAFRESESGTVQQSVTFELDPIAGRMITPITAQLTSVYVPVQAIDALLNPDEDFAGSSDMIRQKLLSGTPLFGLEEEGELSKRLGVVPRSIGGVKKVNEVVRIAHNVAVNFLRRRKYVNAIQLLASSTVLTPALISDTVLDRLNGVLDPEDRVNGKVNFELGNVSIPVYGLGIINTGGTAPPLQPVQHDGADATIPLSKWAGANANVFMRTRENTAGDTFPNVDAIGDLGQAGTVSLDDFYIAERMDALTREMRMIVDANPQYGEEIVTRWAHGLSIDVGKQPFIVHQSRQIFGMQMRRASDGDNLDQATSDLAQQIRFTAVIPPTEFGGVLITFAEVLPDETLASQPHPILSEEWGARNHVADELAVDPVPVTIRELDAECDQADEGTVALYIGNNTLQQNYNNYGLNRQLDPSTVENKTAVWQLEVPMSVTPESVLYPDDLEHYPFDDQLAEICTYTVTALAQINTPTIYGPTPIEELAEIETSDVFDDA